MFSDKAWNSRQSTVDLLSDEDDPFDRMVATAKPIVTVKPFKAPEKFTFDNLFNGSDNVKSDYSDVDSPFAIKNDSEKVGPNLFASFEEIKSKVKTPKLIILKPPTKLQNPKKISKKPKLKSHSKKIQLSLLEPKLGVNRLDDSMNRLDDTLLVEPNFVYQPKSAESFDEILKNINTPTPKKVIKSLNKNEKNTSKMLMTTSTPLLHSKIWSTNSGKFSDG